MAFVSSSIAVVRPSLQRANVCNNHFFGARAAPVAVRSTSTTRMGVVLPVFTKAMEEFKNEYPQFASRGWGATVKAERWNGRHAMFGFLVLVLTGYVKGHGLIPDPTTPLDIAQWGVLGTLGDTGGITTERAVILVAHIHVLFVSVAAALAPFSFQDKLLLGAGEADEEPAGLFPPLSPGLTKDAELWNSRVAMLGIICLVVTAVATDTSILDVLNNCLGNLLF